LDKCLRDLWLASLYAVVMGLVALVADMVCGVLWVAWAGVTSLGVGAATTVVFWPSAWCLVVQLGRGRVRH
jgi:hypothetical protein